MKTYTIAVSDIHGDLNQLMYPLIMFLSDPKKYSLVLLGDYIDRGESNVYIYEILSRIIKHPRVHALWGNHEIYSQGVQDYISRRSKYRSSGNAFIATFMFDLFNKLDLNVVYYDQRTKILYSHAPLNRPLSTVLQLKKSPESTYTYDVNSKTMEYKNIHGHDHRCSPRDIVDKFFKGKEQNMISIDNDASYGIRLEQNAYTVASDDWVKGVCSNVYFLVINDQDISDYKIISNTIEYGSENDYNCKSFDRIKNILTTEAKDERFKSMFAKMTLNVSYEHFVKCLQCKHIGEVPRYIRHIYLNIIRYHCEDGDSNIYYNDVPYEFYQRALNESENPCKPLQVIVDAGYKPIYNIYWDYIIKDADNYITKENFDAMTGGDFSSGRLYIAMIILITSVIGLAIFCIYKSYVAAKAKEAIGDN